MMWKNLGMTINRTYTTECICTDWGDACCGECWEQQVGDFEELTEALFVNDPTEWRIRLYHPNGAERTVFISADNPQDLLARIPGCSEFTLSVKRVTETYLKAILSHHDAPCGRLIVVEPITNKGE